MCRILGYFNHAGLTPQKIEQAIQQQIHGGPDRQSYQSGKNWMLGNNRLAIQGVMGGEQPFSLGKMHAVYNGEIYNHRALKRDLALRGYTVTDDCDGSVILPLYEIYGEAFVEHLDGMFTIAIVDERETPQFILCNDGAAMKSVYYYADESTGALFFASELAALFELSVPKKLRPTAVDEYLVGRSVWHNNTVFEGIHSLGPRSILTQGLKGKCHYKTYASKVIALYQEGDFLEAANQFGTLFENEVAEMLNADVPVCLVTSGGLDSSYVSALAAKYRQNLACFNVSYEGDWPSADESQFAKEVAKHCGIRYNQVLIKESEFPALLDATIAHLGQPNSAPHSLSTYALFKAVHEAGFKVAMTGDGADEFFGGYERFRNATYDQSENWLQKYFDVMCATTQNMRDTVYSKAYQSTLQGKSSVLKQAILHLQEQVTQKGRLKALLEFDQDERFPGYILRRVDHLSMAHSVEARIPFCQSRITSFATSLPPEYQLDETQVKKIVYQAAKPLLPPSIINRPKHFFVLPIVEMLSRQHVLSEILNETLSSQAFRNRGYFNDKAIQNLIAEQLKNPNNNTANLLWSVMVLERWLFKMEHQ